MKSIKQHCSSDKEELLLSRLSFSIPPYLVFEADVEMVREHVIYSLPYIPDFVLLQFLRLLRIIGIAKPAETP
jgi:hypothetical protein